MSPSSLELAPWLALAALCLSLAGFVAAVWMRTLFAAIASGYCGALFAAVALAAIAQGEAAFGVIAVGAVGVLMAMGAALLAPRAARARPRIGFSAAGAAMLISIVVFLWAAPDVRSFAQASPTEVGAPILLITLIVCVGGLGAYALLGVGSRSTLAPRKETP